jgi:hypothetical protein
MIMRKYIALSFIALSIGLVSCDDWLDKLPDNRMELNSPSDISDLLVSAYATAHPAYLLEMYSDNTDECVNTGWSEADRFQRQAFRWNDITEINGSETPQNLWNSYYAAVAAANASIEHIESQSPEKQKDYQSQLGEALICRAYNMFMLSLVFCNAYTTENAAKEYGLPYPTKTETKVGQQYERGTLAELYANIEKDLLRGLPLLTNVYSKPKFHFNTDAGNAFAARFYLYYCQPEKTIQYANKVLGSNAAAKLRDWDSYDALNANGMIQPEAFVNANERANLMLQVVYSQWGAVHGPYRLGERYAHGRTVSTYETMQSTGPWGASRDFKYTVWYNDALSKYIFRKVPYEFEYTDLQAGIGYAHAEYTVFTTDVLLMERAEAYALTGNLEAAVNDMNTELSAFHSNPSKLTVQNVTNFYNNIDYYQPYSYTKTEKDGNGHDVEVTLRPTPKKHLHPVFTTIDADGSEQESVLQCVLHLKRILTLHEGFRLQDIKRYGITMYRRVMTSNYEISQITDTMEVGDKRLAIQLPQDVMTAGLEGNPRAEISQEGNEVSMSVVVDHIDN